MIVGEARSLKWRERRTPRRWWTRLLSRTAARADVVAPDGRSYVVKAVRVWWPGESPIADIAGDLSPDPAGTVLGGFGLLSGRGVWTVRVFREPNWLRIRPLMYGEHWRYRTNGVKRAREVAEDLANGKRP